MRTLFPECTSCGVDRSPNLRHSWRPLGLNKTRISIERLNGGGSYQVVVDVHDEAPVTTDELLSILTAIWGPETAQELKQLILDETGSFEAEAALPIWPIIMLLSILNSGEARVLSPYSHWCMRSFDIARARSALLSFTFSPHLFSRS